jgi:hypothetical protein
VISFRVMRSSTSKWFHRNIWPSRPSAWPSSIEVNGVTGTNGSIGQQIAEKYCVPATIWTFRWSRTLTPVGRGGLARSYVLDWGRFPKRFYDPVRPYRANVLRVARFRSRSCPMAEDLPQEFPTAPAQDPNDVEYRVQQVGKFSMIMTKKSGNWLCVVAEVSAQGLLGMALR